MSDPIQWSRNPELWDLRGKRLSLRAEAQRSRALRLAATDALLHHEYTRLQQWRRQLVADCQFAAKSTDEALKQRLANQIATFYREVGTLEGRLDSLENSLGLATG